jgi:hypothetical protein
MNRSLSVLLVVLAGCPGDEVNPEVLWLAPDMVETQVKLQDRRPPPF